MPGIERINIIDRNWNAESDRRLKISKVHAPVANMLYRVEFEKLGLPLAAGDVSIDCSPSEAKARPDYAEGIDIYLRTINGQRLTLQEKFLTFYESTITFEESKNSGKEGAWYYCTAQFYFVGYTRLYWDWKAKRVVDNPVIAFQDWMLVNYTNLKLHHARIPLAWEFNKNSQEGRRNPFRFLPFNKVPPECVVARMTRQPIEIHHVIEPAKPKQAEMDKLKSKWADKMRAWNAGESKDLS